MCLTVLGDGVSSHGVGIQGTQREEEWEGPGSAEIPGAKEERTHGSLMWLSHHFGAQGLGSVCLLPHTGKYTENSVLGRIERDGFASPPEIQETQASATQIIRMFQTICQSVFFGSAGNSMRRTEASSLKG